ncbi:MAG: glucosamine-6-phosphate deaminase [Patescibacteria group bacterium]|nr:glucosamine-6-phosphate deaminase [Patescibacteria group bacterium]
MPQSMPITVCPDYDILSRLAAALVFEQIARAAYTGKSFVLGMATGATPEGMYARLVDSLRGFGGNLSRFHTVNLDEYVGLTAKDSESYHHYMTEHFWKPLTESHPEVRPETQFLIPNGAASDPEGEARSYEERIAAIGGIDLQILGIGTNGHIGFNEPGSDGTSRTRVVTLAESTRQDNAKYFGGDTSRVPAQAISMGIATVLEAREILLLASGAAKRRVIEMLRSCIEPEPEMPASYLVWHPRVMLITDVPAAGVR